MHASLRDGERRRDRGSPSWTVTFGIRRGKPAPGPAGSRSVWRPACTVTPATASWARQAHFGGLTFGLTLDSHLFRTRSPPCGPLWIIAAPSPPPCLCASVSDLLGAVPLARFRTTCRDHTQPSVEVLSRRQGASLDRHHRPPSHVQIGHEAHPARFDRLSPESGTIRHPIRSPPSPDLLGLSDDEPADPRRRRAVDVPSTALSHHLSRQRTRYGRPPSALCRESLRRARSAPGRAKPAGPALLADTNGS